MGLAVPGRPGGAMKPAAPAHLCLTSPITGRFAGPSWLCLFRRPNIPAGPMRNPGDSLQTRRAHLRPPAPATLRDQRPQPASLHSPKLPPPRHFLSLLIHPQSTHTHSLSPSSSRNLLPLHASFVHILFCITPRCAVLPCLYPVSLIQCSLYPQPSSSPFLRHLLPLHFVQPRRPL